MSETAAGLPTEFTITSQIEFNRPCDDEYTVEFNYYAQPTGLSSSNTTNIILTNHPNIYIFGILWAINLKYSEEDRATFYYNSLITEIRGANRKHDRSIRGPGARIKTEGPTP